MRVTRLLCGIVLLGLVPATAVAAVENASALRGELTAIYRQLLVNPADIALNRRMIEIALALEDYDAAIGAVERLIFYAPNDPALQIEAAELYLKIKSYAAAAGYLQDVIALPGVSEAQIAEAEALLGQAERGVRGSPWSGFGQVGLRYQTNANIGSVELGLNEPFPFEKPEPDWNAFALGTLALDAPVSKTVSVEGSLSGYYADQQKVDRLDLGFAELAVGPRLSTEDGALSVKPYGTVQGILLGDAPYQFAYGGGVLARWIFADGWFVEPQFDYKDRDYYDTVDYPDAADQTGELYTYALNAGGQFSDSVSWLGRFGYADNDAAKAYQSYDQYFANLSLQVAFDAFGKEGWVFTPFGTISYTDFKGVAPPEEFAGFPTMKEELFWGIGANVEVPLKDGLALGLGVEYNQNLSNLDRDDYENFKIVIGPQGRF
jgi:tetratricopeptide (TPR) repeat protein